MTKTTKRAVARPVRKPSAAKPVRAIAMPPLRKGEHHAGIILDTKGRPEYHLIGLPGKAENVTWQEAQAWAKKQSGELPNLRELGLERVNAGQHFTNAAYWSCEQYAGDASSAWFQSFLNGYQYYYDKSSQLRARAVRRVPI